MHPGSGIHTIKWRKLRIFSCRIEVETGLNRQNMYILYKIVYMFSCCIFSDLVLLYLQMCLFARFPGVCAIRILRGVAGERIETGGIP